jgi:hypothetical protein
VIDYENNVVTFTEQVVYQKSMNEKSTVGREMYV